MPSNLQRRLHRIEAYLGRAERQYRDPFALVYAFNPWLEAHPEALEELRQLIFAILDDDAFEAWTAGDWRGRTDITAEQGAAIEAWDTRLSQCLILAAHEDTTGVIAHHLGVK